MFRNDTVFVLGAGASWHYGYPTGEGLIDNVISMAGRLSRHCENCLKSGEMLVFVPEYVARKIKGFGSGAEGARAGWMSVQAECDALISCITTVRPLVIDYFLAWNESLRPIGKLMIAAAILECEAKWLSQPQNQNRLLSFQNAIKPVGDINRVNFGKYRDDWYRFITHKLVYECQKSGDLLNNKVKFVTFNYDTSLEYHLFRALTAIDLLDPSDVKEFLGDNRIVHVYGSVHKGIPADDDTIDRAAVNTLGNWGPDRSSLGLFEPVKVLLDKCLKASESLRTIDPHDKEENGDLLNNGCQWIDGAGVVYILGYGFDANNNRRIGLDPALRLSENKHKTVMFTNFGDMNTINKKASKLFYGTYEKFLGSALHQGNPKDGDYFEKSVRTVYEALEMDFDALESELVATTKF